MTAAHVVIGASAVKIRCNADRPDEWTSEATLVYSDLRNDVAVLRVLVPQGHDHLSPARFGGVAEHDLVLRCSIFGFPRFKLREVQPSLSTARGIERYRDSCHVVGTIAALSNRRAGTLEIKVDPPEHDPDSAMSPWQGMSGAPVFVAGRIVGIVTEHHRSDGLNRLAASRVDRWYERTPPERLGALVEHLGLPSNDDQLPDVSQSSGALDGPAGATGPGGRSVRQVWDVSAPIPRFVGREDSLKYLESVVALPDRLPVVIAGLGGVGKTQLALTFARRQRAALRFGWWVAAESPAGIIEDYSRLAAELGLAGTSDLDDRATVSIVVRWLEEHTGWLLVFDNVESPAALVGYLPAAGDGTIIITSRNPVWRQLATVIHLGVLRRAESIEFFDRRVGSLDRAAADELAAQLGDLPLALEQAAAYIDETGITVQEYLDIQRKRTLPLPALHRSVDPTAAVESTWLLNFEHITTESPKAMRLLYRSAFLAPDRIPVQALVPRDWRSQDDGQSASATSAEVAEILAALRRYSLISRTGDDRAVHRLVQAVTRQRMTAESRSHFVEEIVQDLNADFPKNVDDMAAWERCDELLPHVLAAGRHVTEVGADAGTSVELLERAAHYCVMRRSYTMANECADLALEIARARPAATRPSTLLVSGDSLRGMGRYALARRAHEQALELLLADRALDDPGVGAAYDAVAHDCYELGRYSEAVDHHRRALEIRTTALGPEHLLVSYSLDGMGHPLRGLGQFDEALRNYQAALPIRQRVLGARHPEVAETLDGIGHALRGLGHFERSVVAHREAERICEAALTLENPQLADTLNGLGYSLAEAGDTDGAIDAHRRSLNINERNFGADHPRVAVSLNGLGHGLRSAGQFIEAEQCHARALTIYESELGRTHPRYALSAGGIGNALYGQGLHARALVYHALAREVYLETIGGENLWMVDVLEGLAEDHMALGESDAATEFYESAATVVTTVYGPGHPRLARLVKAASEHGADLRQWLNGNR